jgi:hypothetical protein
MSDVTLDEVVTSAQDATSLHDLGDPAWREGLEVLLASVVADADLNDAGRQILRAWIEERLENRLRVVHWVTRHHEVRTERVTAPIVVVGMLRTGSTIFSELLAADPANRPLMKWEGLNAVPPPTKATFHRDKRIAAEVEKQEAVYSMVPDLKAVHWEPGDGPTECVALLTQSFRSQDWYGLFRVPSYLEWFHACDMRAAYAYHKLSLQLLQSQAPGRWSLKAPGHLLALDALRATYPDACIVVLHRDPMKAVPSSASLSMTSRPDSLSNTDVRPHFPPMWLDVLGTMTDRLVDHRDRYGDNGFVDVQYTDFVADPIGTMRSVYAAFGDELTDDAEGAMRAHLAGHARGAHGAHRYTPEEFGLDPVAIRDRFAGYCERFGIEDE